MDAEARIQRLLQFVDEGRVIRHEWHSCDRQGRETACLLGALGPDIDEPAKCPADVMPEWMAHLTIAIDDAGSSDAWRDVVKRYARLAARWHVLDAADWRRLELEIALKAIARKWPRRLDDRGLCEALANDRVPPSNADVRFTVQCVREETGFEYRAAYRLWAIREQARDVCLRDPIGLDSLLTTITLGIAEDGGIGALRSRDLTTELVLAELELAIAAKEARAA